MGGDDEEALALLRWATEQSGVGTSELARRMGMKRQSIEQYLTKKRTRIGWCLMLKWLRACGLRITVTGER